MAQARARRGEALHDDAGEYRAGYARYWQRIGIPVTDETGVVVVSFAAQHADGTAVVQPEPPM